MRTLTEVVETESGVILTKKANTDGGEFAGACPFCGGKDRFRVWPQTDKFWCRGCNQKGDSIAFVRTLKQLNYKEACELVGKELQGLPKRGKSVVKRTSWGIKDADGHLVATHIRLDFSDGSKEYPWEIDGKLGLRGVSPSSLPLYGTEHLIEWGDGQDIIICEGEKAAEALQKKGFHALGTVCGAQSIPGAGSLKCLVGRKCNILLWPDNDAPGQKHMTGICEALRSAGTDAYTIQWEKAKPKQDAADYVDLGLPVQELLDHAKQHRTAPYYPPSKTVTEYFDQVMDAFDGVKPEGLISTGYRELDSFIDGYQRWLTVICARTGVGKTTYGLQSVVRAATPEAKGVIISLETPAAVVCDRLAKYDCGLNRQDIRRAVAKGPLSSEIRDEWMNRITGAYTKVYDLPILIRDKQGLTPDELRRDIEMLMERDRIGVILIDHMGKIKVQGKTAYEKASLVSKELSSIAIEYSVPIVALCQLSREVESRDRKDKRPQLGDLRNSGEIEEDARVVLGLYRDDYYMDSEPPLPGLTQVLVLKYNEGEARMTVPLEFNNQSKKLTPWPAEKRYLFDEYIKNKAWLPRK
jgi:replicative DNA helicase